MSRIDEEFAYTGITLEGVNGRRGGRCDRGEDGRGEGGGGGGVGRHGQINIIVDKL
jgi:hypothetical protein